MSTITTSRDKAQTGQRAHGTDPVLRAAAAQIRSSGARVEGVVERHFRLRGTLRLHASALGGDMLRAPVNLFLAPVHALLQLLAFVVTRLGAQRAGAWLRGRRVLLPTRVGREVEQRILTDLLGLPLPDQGSAGPASLDHDDMVRRAFLSAPQLRPALRQHQTPAAAEAQAGRLARILSDYAGTRSAVAEIVTALVLLVIGALVFRTLTPGMISMAPNLAGVVAHGAAVAAFPLGETLGGVWYGVFPVGASPWLIGVVVIALVMLGSVMAAFAGILADPVQARLGIHRRRLHRMIEAMAREIEGSSRQGFAAHEHLLARVMDLVDALASLARAFRG